MCEKFYNSPEKIDVLKTSLKNFTNKLKQKWMKCSYTEKRFFQRHNDWLEKDFLYPKSILKDIASTSAKVKSKLYYVSVHKGKKALSQCSEIQNDD